MGFQHVESSMHGVPRIAMNLSEHSPALIIIVAKYQEDGRWKASATHLWFTSRHAYPGADMHCCATIHRSFSRGDYAQSHWLLQIAWNQLQNCNPF